MVSLDGTTTELDRRTILGGRFLLTASTEHPDTRASFGHSSVERKGLRVTTWGGIRTDEPAIDQIPARVYLKALYTTAPFVKTAG
ncbi:MAG: hypothetical protein LH477_09880 [Nocardioides sp.]|nr:hypothetical protein [Nocardioides sp.]